MSTNEAVPQTRRYLSPRRLSWASLAAIVGCAGACALPMLATVGVGGGVLAGLAHFYRPGIEFVAGGVAFIAALGFMAFRARHPGSALGCSGSCAVPRVGGGNPTR